MAVQRLSLTPLMIVFACQVAYAQAVTQKLKHRDGFRFYKETMVHTGDSSLLQPYGSIIILKETDKFILFSCNAIFRTNLQNYITEYNISWDKQLLNELDKQSGDVVLANNIAHTALGKKSVDLRIAELLKKGDCLIYNKRSKKLERNVTIKWYRVGRKCVADGVIFYVNAAEILVTEDGNS